MADKPTVQNGDAGVEQNGVANGDGHIAKLQADSRPPMPGDRAAATDLNKITDDAAFRTAVQGLIKEAKDGKPVTFNVDARDAAVMTGADGKPIKGATQASILYDELQKAYPDNHFTFSKPDLKPGDQGYAEIPAPIIKQDGTHISTKENAITLDKEVKVGETTLPAGSQFAVGTVFDGQNVRSADPTGKVWATTPDGKMVQVAGAGESAAMSADAISKESAKMGQVANAKTGDGFDNHIIVREASAKDPDGKPLLDAYPSGGASFEAAYKEGSAAGMYAAKAKSADHFKLPENVTVQAQTNWGDSTASGTKKDYYMQSGFADALDATGKNYTGQTDERSARELLRARAEAGLTGPTQAEAGLARVGDAQTAKAEDMNKITDEATFRARAQELIRKAQAGENVTFDVDTRVGMTGADGKPIKGATQASMLYEELKAAYPDSHYVFAKPDLKPGDKGYSEIPAPEVKQDGGVRLSSKENAITTTADIATADGGTLPAGSKFAVGTTYDGKQVKSADPSGKVWATTPDGKMVQVADAGQSLAIDQGSMSSDPKSMGQIANQGDHIIVRTAGGKENVDPDGKPLLDAYPNSGDSFLKNYKPGTTADMWAPKAKSADHLALPGNITVEADTEYGHATAAGTKQDYYMSSGFADAKDATAKNYTGETDVRSAKELMRIRQDVGLTEPTQVEAGLQRAEGGNANARAEQPTGGEKVWTPDNGSFRDAAAVVPADAKTVTALESTIPKSVLDAMAVNPDQRTAEQKRDVEKYMTDLGLDAKQQEMVEEKTREGMMSGKLPYVAALATALALAGAYYATHRKEQTANTYKQ